MACSTSGPGQGSLHLELRRRVRAPVDAVEPSAAFARRIRRVTSRDGFGAGRLWTCSLLDADLPSRHYDLIFARWVFLFLPDPEVHLRKLARALKPGGLLALQEYHRDSFVLIPRPTEWTQLIEAESAIYRATGGDINVGTRLPVLFRRAGLRTVDVVPTIKSAGLNRTCGDGCRDISLESWIATRSSGLWMRLRRGGFAAPGSTRNTIGRR